MQAEERVFNHPKITVGHPEVIAAEREYCRRKLSNFIKRAWHVIEPAMEYSHGWHIDAICEHLEAVTHFQINRLAIAVPPGSMKSLSTGVFWPMWEWGPREIPHYRTVATSHGENLAVRDNLRAKRLVESEWYQDRWGDTVKMTRDQSSKMNFENTATGWRQASPFKSTTGKRGDRVIIDDPLSAKDANSEAMRNEVIETFQETIPTRVNSPEKSAIVMIMQRLHENDLIGFVTSRDMGYDYLMIPMEFEPSRRIITSIGWTDPRTEEGQLMFEKRFPKEVVERDKTALGPYAAAGQLQQSPVPRKGGLFEVDRLKYIPALPLGVRKLSVRGWDLAGTEGAGAYTAGVKLTYIFDTKRLVIEDVRRERFSSNRVRRMLDSTAELDGVETFISIPKDPGQAGKDQAQDIVTELAGYSVVKEPQSGSKELRAEPLSSQVEAGNVDLVIAPWNEDFVNEMRFFPRGTYKDQIDAASSAFNLLMKKVKYHYGGDLAIGGETQTSWTSELSMPGNSMGMMDGTFYQAQ